MLQTLTGNCWTHKTVANYTQLFSDTPDVLVNMNITQMLSASSYNVTSSPFNVSGMLATVIQGTGFGQTSVCQTGNGYVPNSTFIYFATNFSIPLDNTSVIQFQIWHSYKDVTLVGIPANHIITGVKVFTLASFTMDTTGYSVWTYIGNNNLLLTPVNAGDNLLTNIHSTYGMADLTIPNGNDDSYEYGSFRWFTFSAPGGPTYSRNQLPGNPTIGSYCLPQRLDAHDVIARFCILSDTTSNPASPKLLDPIYDNMVFNYNVKAGDVEITVQYTPL